MMESHYKWHFLRTGRVPQVAIACGEDLVHLKELDRKLWSALSVPCAGLRFDARTLELLDADHDGIIRVPEVLSAVDWALAHVDAPEALFNAGEAERAALDKVLGKLKDLAAAELSPADAAARTAWADVPAKDPAILPLGDATPAADAACAAVEATLDAYFAVPDDLPLVTDEPVASLPLAARLNPRWAAAIATFVTACAQPILKCGDLTELTRADWSAVKAALAPYRAWQAAKPVAAADTQVRLLDEERLLRYRLHLVDFLRNFVNQADLYDAKTLSVAQTGTLFIDARQCDLCFHVDDLAAHAACAEKSDCCLLYVKLTRAGAAPRTVCAVVTAGRTGTLYVGRNGLFVDRDGRDWNASVVKVVAAQVSLCEAFWAPWTKLFGMVAEQVKKFVGTRQEAAFAKAGTVAAAPSAPANGAVIASSVAALGMGVGMLGAACAGLLGVLAGLPPWKVAAGLAALFLMVSLPSAVLAWFKLRRRDLGVVLNACGWAVNRPLYFSLRLARMFTRLACRGGRA